MIVEKGYRIDIKNKNGWRFYNYYINKKCLNAGVIQCLKYGLIYKVSRANLIMKDKC